MTHPIKKAVILAGGFGSRISEESHLKPKPMVEIGGRPILWHIMKGYAAHGINEFIICLGYKGYIIKEYFQNHFLHTSDITFDMQNHQQQMHTDVEESWKVTVVDTGEHSMTGGRLKRVEKYLNQEDFCFTYGDGVSDIDITKLIAFHYQHKKIATVTAVQPPSRFGIMNIEKHIVTSFREKPSGDNWVNGGYFVLSNKSLDYIDDDTTVWEQEPMHQLVKDRELAAYQHAGFWYPMDTLRDNIKLEEMWQAGNPPWKKWED